MVLRHQLISITHEIYKSFDDGLELGSIFFCVSKAFNKVCQDGFIFKLTQNGTKCSSYFNGLDILIDLLKAKKQRSVLNWQSLLWSNVKAEIPQVSILVHCCA